jgi:two-component system response regulator YesN
MNIFKEMSYFKKLLISYIAVILVPAVILSAVYFYYYSAQVEEGMKSESQTNLHNYSSLIQAITSEMDRASLQFSLIPQLSLILKDTNYNAYDYRILQNTMQTSISSNSLFHSVYLFTKINSRVLTTGEGIYPINDFYDKTVIDEASNNENVAQWHEIRTLKTGEEVITFSRRVPTASKESLGIFIFNIRKDIFFETVQLIQKDEPQPIFVMDSSKRVVFPLTNQLSDDLASFYKKGEMNQQGWTRVQLDDKRYFMSSMKSPMLGWSYIRLVPVAKYNELLSHKLLEVLLVILAVTLLFTGMSYLLSLMMYFPFKRIISGIKERLKSSDPYDKRNEFDFVENALHQILSENEQIKTSVLQNQPIIKERWVNAIFNRIIHPDDVMSAEHMRETGIDFTKTHFMDLTVIMDLRSHTEIERNKIRLFIFSMIENAFSLEFGIAGTILNDDSFGFIINTNHARLDNEFRQVLQEISYPIIDLSLTELNSNLQFIYGSLHSSLEELSLKRTSARNLRYNAIINEVDVVIMEDLKQSDTVGYPAQFVQLLLMCIRSGDQKKVQETVSQLFQTYVYPTKSSHDKLVEMLMMLLSVIVHELRQENEYFNELADGNLLQLNDAHSKQELETLVLRFIDRLVFSQNTGQDDNRNVHIIRAIEYIKDNYQKNISISDIAHYLQISPSYLSRTFKNECGKSPLEYLTEFRMERGKAYLEDNKLSLQEISSLIGYNDSHSFIRYFKKYAGTTPGEYRVRVMRRL